MQITGAIRGTSKEKFYQELGLESLEKKDDFIENSVTFIRSLASNLLHICWILFLCLADHTLQDTSKLFLLLKWDMTFFENSLFPSTVIEWNKTDKNIRKPESLNIFKNSILKHIRPSQNIVCNCHSPKGIKLLARLRVGLSHLHKYKLKHSFQFSVFIIFFTV